MLELLGPLRAGMGGDLLSIDAQREIRWVQKTSDGIGRDRDIHLVENAAIFSVVLGGSTSTP